MKKSKLKNKKESPWVKFYPEGVKQNLKYSESSMVGYLLEAVARYPESIAYDFYGFTCTYRDLYEKIRECAKSLKTLGIEKGDRVTICMPNTPSAVIMFYAINMVGGIASMVHPLSAENEIEEYLNNSESKILFVLDLCYSKVRNIIDTTKVKKVIITSVSDDLKNIKKLVYKYNSRGKVPTLELNDDVMTWREFLNYGYDYQGEVICLQKAEDVAVILYSGGTSGVPKGILLSNRNFNALALQAHKMVEATGQGKSLLAILPIFHGFGLGVCIHTPLCCGMKVILVPDFSPKKFISLIKKNKPNAVCAVPSLLEMFVKETSIGKKDLECLEAVISGGDFMSENLKERIDASLKEHGSKTEVRVGYGLTEATAATCLTPTNRYKNGSIGIPFPDTLYKIVAVGTHEELKPNEDGEICICGPTVMQGYMNNESETLQTLRVHEDGKTWLHTGDIGYMDEDGYIYYRQRLKRMIVSNGYNLYPSHMENVINSHPDVLTSTVIGIPHPQKIQVAKAFIVLNDGVEPSKETMKKIKQHCEINLAKYSLPAEYEFRDSFPKTLVGKVAYTKLEKEEAEKLKGKE
ncbi:MAG: AMP-binding protein [Bacilli bacterium]|nr:AMP-binding protein [Bacilli bacterium]